MLATIGLLLATVAIIMFTHRKWSASAFNLALLCVLLINLFGVDWNFMEGKSPNEVLSQGGGWQLSSTRLMEHFRVYSPILQPAAADRCCLPDPTG